jgi:molybdenum cofactor cytidylyltransferase
MNYAVIPAGGKSSRMGRPKLALPVAGRTVLELVIDALRRGGMEHILVVAGSHVADLVPLARAARAMVHLLVQETPDMRATVVEGLRWLEEHFHPCETDTWLLAPADHPTLDAAVVRQLLQAEGAHGSRSLFIPTYRGQRGHPALIRWHHVPAIRALPSDTGLNAYFRHHTADKLEVAVETESVLVDLDTPEDYQRLLQTYGK